MATELINEVGHKSDYLMQMHTMDSVRTDHVLPKLINRNFFEVWQTEGSASVMDNANNEIDKIIDSYQLSEKQNNVVNKHLEKYGV